jgi:serine/threonine-protein kinase 24/25/MST4
MTAEGDMASQYQMLEELGSESIARLRTHTPTVRSLTPAIGGSFGTVYKAIERATGEVVAIKHVR